MKDRPARFVEHYLATGNATKAAEAAGYSSGRARRTGSELLRRPDVAAAIRRGQSERARKLAIDADFVVHEALEVLRQSRRGNVVTYHGVGVLDPEEDGEFLHEFNAAGALGAINTIVKVLGLGAAERKIVEHEGEIVYTLRIDGAPDVIDGSIVPPALEGDFDE